MVGMLRPEVLLLLLVLIFSPLAFGTVEPWSRAIADGAALAGLAAALLHRTRNGRLTLHAVPGALPLLLFLGFLLLQCLPLPPALLRLLSPAAHARWDAALGGAGPLPWLPLSLDPLATARECLRFSACAALYVLTVQLLARHRRLRAVTTVLACFAALLSFEAILQHLAAPRTLLFIRAAPSHLPFGPFVNRNHYANLMAMLAPVVFALYLGREDRGSARPPRSVRERAVDLLARPEAHVRLLLGFAALLCAASLVISVSRGAIVAVTAALLVFGALVAGYGHGRRRSAPAALFFLALAVFVGWFGWGRVGERFAGLPSHPTLVDPWRAGPWRDSLRLIADFPVFGAGVGSFEHLYPAYRTVSGPTLIAHAHNDYLELLAGGGVVGLGLLGWFVGGVLLRVVRTCRGRRDRSALFLAFGSLAGCVAFLVHGATDFSLAIGANALYFFFLLGLAVSAASTRRQPQERGTLLAERHLPAALCWATAALASAAVLASVTDLAARHAWQRARLQTDDPTSARGVTANTRRLIEKAHRLQPLEAAYPAALARIAARERQLDEALRLTRRALRLLPLDGAALVQLGAIHGVRLESAAARRSFTAALAVQPADATHREAFGAWLLAQGDLTEAASQMRAAMALEPARAARIFSLLLLAGFTDERLAAAVPPDPLALLAFARYAAATGADQLAAQTYRRVLEIEPSNPQAIAALRAYAASR